MLAHQTCLLFAAEFTTHLESDLATVCSTSCFNSTILASVISIITTALLATVVFVLVQIALCKCRPKGTPGGAESAPSAGGEGQAVYEQVDGEAVSGPTYMELQAVRKDTFALKSNEAYAICNWTQYIFDYHQYETEESVCGD